MLYTVLSYKYLRDNPYVVSREFVQNELKTT